MSLEELPQATNSIEGSIISWPLQSLQQSGRTHPLFYARPATDRPFHCQDTKPLCCEVPLLHVLFSCHYILNTRMITVFQQITCIRNPSGAKIHCHHYLSIYFLHHFANSLIPTWLGSILLQAKSKRLGLSSTGPTPSSRNNWTQNCLPDNG